MKEGLLYQLKEYVQNKSVDELKSIKPYTLMHELHVTDRELKELVDFLYDKGTISFKYNIRCLSCGINHTIYQNELRKGTKECEECGGTIDLKNMIRQSNMLFVLDKSEILTLGSHIDFKAESIKKIIELSRLKTVKDTDKYVNKKEDTMEIFIGSSTEAASEIDQIAVVLEEKGFDALPWNSKGKGIFRATNFTMENLINTADRVCAAIFIFNSDDDTWYSSNNIKASTVRDNVLFEYGLFVGKKGRNKVVFICKNKPKLASDLNGITYIDADKGEYTMKLELKDWLDSLN